MSLDTIHSLIEQLPTASPKERDRIAEELERLGAQSVPPLIEALGHEERFVRLVAATVLGRLRSVESVPALVQAMSQPYIRGRRAAMGALISIGEPSIGAVRAACAPDDPTIWRHSLTILRRLGVRDTVPEGMAALQCDDARVRREGAKLLLATGDDQAFAAAVDGLSDEPVAGSVAQELLGMGERGREALLNAAHGEDAVARRVAAVELAKNGNPETLGTLLDSYAQDEMPVSWEAPGVIEAAVAAGHDVPFEKLLDQAGGVGADPADPSSHHEQRPAIDALGKIGDPRAVPVLVELTGSDHAVLARLALRALEAVGTDACIPPLVEALAHGHASVRGEAGSALARVGLRALDHMLQALGSDNRAQREIAAHVLSVWGEPALPGLLEATSAADPTERWTAFFGLIVLARRHPAAISDTMRDAALRGMQDDDAGVRRWAARLGGEIRGDEVMRAVVDTLTDPDRQTRRRARRSLAEVGPEAIPFVVRAIRDRILDDTTETWPAQMLGKALGAIGEPAVPAALELADSPTRLVRFAAGSALDESRSELALPGLLKLARENDTDVAASAMWGLGHMPCAEAVEGLEHVASNEGLRDLVRQDARYYAKSIRQQLRLAEEEPDADDPD